MRIRYLKKALKKGNFDKLYLMRKWSLFRFTITPDDVLTFHKEGFMLYCNSYYPRKIFFAYKDLRVYS